MLLPLKRQTVQDVVQPYVVLSHSAGIGWGRQARIRCRAFIWMITVSSSAAVSAVGVARLGNVVSSNTSKRDVHPLCITVGITLRVPLIICQARLWLRLGLFRCMLAVRGIEIFIIVHVVVPAVT